MPDAGTMQEIFRPLRKAVLEHVIGRGDDGVALRRADRHCDHIERQALAIADAGIEALREDIDKTVVDGDLEADAGVARKETDDHRRENGLRRARHIEAQCAGRRGAKAVHFIDRLGHFGKNGREPRRQPLARLGRRDRAGRAVEEPHTKPFLEIAHRLTQRRS
jgi:hypothetical protein